MPSEKCDSRKRMKNQRKVVQKISESSDYTSNVVLMLARRLRRRPTLKQHWVHVWSWYCIESAGGWSEITPGNEELGWFHVPRGYGWADWCRWEVCVWRWSSVSCGKISKTLYWRCRRKPNILFVGYHPIPYVHCLFVLTISSLLYILLYIKIYIIY